MARKTVNNGNYLSEEELKQINPENIELLDDFKEYLESIDRSEGTVNGYMSDSNLVFSWLLKYAKNKHFTEITKRDIVKFQNYLINELNLGAGRIRRVRSFMSSMSNFIESVLDDEYPTFRNIISKIPAPTNNPVRKKTILEDEQVQGLLDYLVEHKQYQKACALALAWASGSRKSELLRFKVSYFEEENKLFGGSLYKTPEKMKTKGRGKAGKLLDRYVLVGKFQPYFDLWMQERKELGIESDNLFLSTYKNNPRPMKVGSLDNYAEIFTKFLNVDFYFHCLRHNFTTGLSKAGIPHHVIKEIVGWQEVSMVQIYDDSTVEDKLGDYFGEDGIKAVEKKGLSDL